MCALSVSAVCQKALEQEVRARLPLLELTPRARQVLHASAKEAEQLGHHYIGTEHLLLGLLAESDGIAAQVIRGLGVTDAIRESLRQVMSGEGYSRGSNRAVDVDGNFLGYLVTDADWNAMLVDEAGNPVPPSPATWQTTGRCTA
jgi:ATP-dependent Clp protease ATP-binding subunit ClpA